MRILLSAFACTPEHRTLDEEIGWCWAIALARAGRDVTVLTASRDRGAIEAWLARNREVTIAIRYADTFGSGRFARFVWQGSALLALLRSGEWQDHDLIHHLTPGSIRQWSWLWLLPRPFVIGPLYGAERAPLRFVVPMGTGPLLYEFARRLLLWLSNLDPAFIAMQARASCILLTAPETASALLPPFRAKSTARIAIGAPTVRTVPGSHDPAAPVRLLFAAPLDYANGGDLLADIAAELESRGRRYELLMLGTGPRQGAIEQKLKRVRHLRILAAGAPSAAELATLYRQCDVAVIPTLRSSTGVAVLEAMAHGLPIVCLDIGVPPMLVGDGGEIVSTAGKNHQDLCRDFADAIVRLAEDPARRAAAGRRARERASRLTWDAAARSGYTAILERVAEP